MNLNQLSRQVIIFIAGFIAFFTLIGIAGNIDRVEQTVYSMPQEAYEAIYLKLGNRCSDRQIANEYLSNKKYYDSLSNE